MSEAVTAEPAIDPYARRQRWRFRGKGPNGRNLCHCGCGREVQPPRRSAFSDECVTNWKRINDPATIAEIVLERDKGICAHCGLDTVALRDTCLPYGSNAIDQHPDLHAIAVELGYDHQYISDRYHQWKTRPEVEAAYEVAHYIWTREIELPWRAFQEQRVKECAEMGFTDPSRRWWEADHIVPVIEGGGGVGPEGYRTLCLPCHRRETAKLAQRLAHRRRTAKQPELTLEPQPPST